MPFAIGDRITLAPARGGYECFVTDIVGGPGGPFQYFTQSANTGDLDEGVALVAEVDIASGPGAVPTYSVGQQITLYGTGGVIIADNGDDTYDIEFEWYPNEHLTLDRVHSRVMAWRIAIENGG